MTTINYLGESFQLWNRQHAWFWLVAGPGREGAAIGVAASEPDAVRDACSSIDEMSARKTLAPSLSIWQVALLNLDQYLRIPLRLLSVR
jgi:hypothetical protein